jgi:hypothetical protein
MNSKDYVLVFVFAAALFSLCSCVHSVESYSKPDFRIQAGRVGILPFSSNIPEVGKVVSDTIGANLLAAGYTVVERTHMAKILQDQDLGYLEVDLPDYKKIGILAGVDFLLVGNIAFSSATVRLVDATTGESLIITTFQPNKITGSASAIDMGECLGNAIEKRFGKISKL